MKNIFKTLFVVVMLLTAGNAVYADLNIIVRDGDTIFSTNTVPLPTVGTISINDSGGTAHNINSQSVLAVLSTLSDFQISEITNFGFSLYLKCITYPGRQRCDNWQYVVNNTGPGMGMDQYILKDGDELYVYFGPQNRIIFNSNTISTSEAVVVSAQSYDYENNTWTPRTGVTVGLTQPNPADPFSPIEITTNPVDTNGQATFTLIPEGSYNVGIKEDYYFPTENLVVNKPSSGGGGGSSGNNNSGSNGSKSSIVPKGVFDVDKAISFLVSNQKIEGDFGEDIYTDWVSVALGATDKYTLNKSVLIKHLTEHKLKDAMLTDYERRALALMSLGINPYNVNGENYIEKILSSFDGKQFGDPNEDNDDIFALIVLQNTEVDMGNKMIRDDVNFILDRQKKNGSWDESVDMTGAGIEALAFFKDQKEVDDALDEARQFLKQSQKEDGGWVNISSTAWAVQGITALEEKATDWRKNSGPNPLQFLGGNQEVDGGITGVSTLLPDEIVLKNRLWETAYAINAVSGKSWNQSIPHFEKPVLGSVLGVSTKNMRKPVVKKPVTENITTLELAPETKTETNKNWFMKLVNFIF